MEKQESYHELFVSLTHEEIVSLLALPWQAEPILGEAVAAILSEEVGLLYLNGFIPFTEIIKKDRKYPQDARYLKTDILAQYLLENRSLLRAYLSRVEKLSTFTCEVPQSYIAHVTSEQPGMEAANFAIFLGAHLQRQSGKTLLIDADPQNQSLFSLLTFSEEPKLLTENLQKPTTFKNDLAKVIVPLSPNISYLNLQSLSLRPFSEAELQRICGFLEMDFDNLVFYAGRHESRWLSLNAQINYCVCENTLKSEQSALIRHRGSLHTVLLKKGDTPYLPRLGKVFLKKRELTAWAQEENETLALRTFILHLYRTKRLLLAGDDKEENTLGVYTGVDLFAHYLGLKRSEAEKALKLLQKKLTAHYPKKTFFSTSSFLKHLKTLLETAATTILEIGSEPQLVSCIDSVELKAAAILPAGIYPATTYKDIRIAACSASGFVRFKERIERGGITSIFTKPKIPLKNPNALAAVMEQLQP
ncbi:MAG: hypothetical protein LDLANPLL_01334 [Turneriella sp.]|nr:hypothetical protein [Turneriella sp.]